MSVTRIRGKGQVTIPRALREALHLEEGDPIEIEVTDEGILLRPQKVIDVTQAWFWTTSWQRGERKASEDIAAGRVKNYKASDDFLNALDE